MIDFAQALRGVYGAAPPVPPEPPPVVAPPTEAPTRQPKGVDMRSVAEAQRIYAPGLPPTKPRSPGPEAGTAGALDVGGAWGSPEAKA